VPPISSVARDERKLSRGGDDSQLKYMRPPIHIYPISWFLLLKQQNLPVNSSVLHNSTYPQLRFLVVRVVSRPFEVSLRFVVVGIGDVAQTMKCKGAGRSMGENMID
jgi:hypothetical protein